MSNDDTTTTDAVTPSVVLDRTFDAPVDVVWRMWTESEHFAAWYGPTGATIPVAEMDVQVGGQRKICMDMGTPDGVMQMTFTGEYREIDEPRRLVYTETMEGAPSEHPAETEVVVELEDLGGQTRVTLTHRGVPADSPGAMGWQMAFDKLATRLSTIS